MAPSDGLRDAADSNLGREPGAGGVVPAIVRVVLLGGLSVTLLALVAAGVLMVTRPPPERAPEVLEQDADLPRAEVPRERVRRTSRPPPVPPVSLPCTPILGHACWRGRIVVSEAQVQAWLEREQDRADAPEPPEPPPSRETMMEEFRVVAVQRDDPPPDLQVELDDEGKPVERQPRKAEVAPDGSFVLQVEPGRYDVEVANEDNSLVGGVDGLVARAGAAESGVELDVAPGLTIAGRVLDAAETGVSAMVRFTRGAQHDPDYRMADASGTFRLDALRPGSYRLQATGREISSTPVEAQASAEGVRLRVAWAPRGLLMVAARDNGRCPLGILEVRHPGAFQTRVRLEDCQAFVGPVELGRPYQVKGAVAGRSYDTTVVFQGSPPSPVCLDPWCGAETAQVRVRVVDATGTSAASASVSVCAGSLCEDLWASPTGDHGGRFTPGRRLVVRATGTDDQGAGEATILTVPGVNDVVVRLPER